MNEIVIPSLYLLVGICFYAAGNHLSFGLQQSFDRIQIIFAVITLNVSFSTLALIQMFQAVDVSHYAVSLKWNLAFKAGIYVLFPWFIGFYTGRRLFGLQVGLSIFFSIMLLINTFQPYSLQYNHIRELKFIHLAWGETLAFTEGKTTGLFKLGIAGILVIFGYMFYALGSLYRQSRNRHVLGMLIAAGLYWISSIEGILARISVIDFIPLGPFGFVAMVIMMSILLTHQHQQQLRVSENRFRSLVEQSPFSIQILASDGYTVKVNPAWEKLWGVKEKQISNYNIFEDVQLMQMGVTSIIQRSFSGEVVDDPSIIFNPADNPLAQDLFHDRWIRAYIYPIKDETGQIHETIMMHEDVTEKKLAEEKMQLAALVYQTSNQAMMVMEAENKIIAVNPAFTEITGYSAEEVVGNDPQFLSIEYLEHASDESAWHLLSTKIKWQGEVWSRRKNGEIFPEWLTMNTILNEQGSVLRRVALFSDITEKKKNEEKIWHQANFDMLTGLPNRRKIHDRLEYEIRKSQRSGLSLALLFIDLDLFKEVNDSLGHEAGDFLLKIAAQRMVKCVRGSDAVGRLGGDEFTIILGELDNISSVGRIAKSLLEVLAEPYQLDSETTYITASIGITLCPDDATDASTMLKNADQAMYASKRDGRNRFQYYTPAMQEAVINRMRLSNDLRIALIEQQFIIYYQPIIDLRTGGILKAEALIRWNHPTRGMVSPAEFIPIAEETGLIIEIGDWVFRQAAVQALKWRDRYYPDFQISINKSPVQFRQGVDNHSNWFSYLAELGLGGQSIVIEITEGVLMAANEHITDQLLGFRDEGMQVALDDFGTGYSSLSYLKSFDIDYLKIDQSFVRNLSSNSNDLVLCEAMVEMAHKLGLKVIAEGIETSAQRDLLVAMNCDYGQGYFYAKPQSADDFEKLFSVNH